MTHPQERRLPMLTRIRRWGGALAIALLSLATTFARADIVGESATFTIYELGPDSAPPSSGGGFEPGPSGSSNLGTFDIVIVPGATLAGNAAALAAFNRAAQQWEAFISDPITVTVNADLAPLGAGILGSTSSVALQASYATIRNPMVTDASNEADDAIALSLPSASNLFTLPAGRSLSGNLVATKANLKALNFTGLDGTFGTSDGMITFSTNFAFDFDNSNGVSGGQFDFETVAAHEIGHLLGFFSSVDQIVAGSTSISPTTLDMFRFAEGGVNDPGTTGNFATFPRLLVPGAASNFDQINGIDGALAEIALSTGTSGDGSQASHWKADDITGINLGVMDPSLAPGVITLISANDLQAFDLIGYEIAAIPEVGSLVMLSAVCALSAVVVRVRRTRARAS